MNNIDSALNELGMLSQMTVFKQEYDAEKAMEERNALLDKQTKNILNNLKSNQRERNVKISLNENFVTNIAIKDTNKSANRVGCMGKSCHLHTSSAHICYLVSPPRPPSTSCTRLPGGGGPVARCVSTRLAHRLSSPYSYFKHAPVRRKVLNTTGKLKERLGRFRGMANTTGELEERLGGIKLDGGIGGPLSDGGIGGHLLSGGVGGIEGPLPSGGVGGHLPSGGVGEIRGPLPSGEVGRIEGPLPASQTLLCSSIDKMDLNDRKDCAKSHVIDLNSPD